MTAPEAGWVLVHQQEPDRFDWAEYNLGGVLVAEVEKDGRRFPVIFYEPTRLGQSVAMGTEGDKPYYEPNLIVVPEITQAIVEAAVEQLGQERFFDWMLER
jgi:hypothetical protein